METLYSYLRLWRMYSLIDMALLLAVAGATGHALWGAVLLHTGFLGYLEYDHKRSYRAPVPLWSVLSAWGFGLLLFGKLDGLAYIVLSVLYSKKKTWHLELVTPLLRGLQTLVMVGVVAGYNHALPWLAMVLMIVRNLLGDLRDAQEDASEGKWTWPAVLGMKSRPFAHLFGMFATTTVWWLYAANLSGWLLAAVLAIEAATYWLTPRRSNRKAALWLHSKILTIFRR